MQPNNTCGMIRLSGEGSMFGEWLRAERERRGWSQQQLADRVGVTQQAIYLLERGKRPNPGGKMLAGLARAFGISIDDLLVAASGQALTPQPPEVYLAALQALGVPRDALDDLITLAAADAIPPERWREFIAMAQWRMAQDQAAQQPQERRRRGAARQPPAEVPPDEPTPDPPSRAAQLAAAHLNSR